jgi:hypothetical protein
MEVGIPESKMLGGANILKKYYKIKFEENCRKCVHNNIKF